MSAQKDFYTANEYGLLIADMQRDGIETVHFTNGSFKGLQPQIARFTVAGFQYIQDHYVRPFTAQQSLRYAFVIGVNSKNSEINHYNSNPATLPSELERVNSFQPALRSHFPRTRVYSVLFDEAAALPIHSALFDNDIQVQTEFKFGWGLEKKRPIITDNRVWTRICFTYKNQQVPANFNNGPWDAQNPDPLDKFKNEPHAMAASLEDQTATAHSLHDTSNPQTIRYLDNDDYLAPETFPNSPLINPSP